MKFPIFITAVLFTSLTANAFTFIPRFIHSVPTRYAANFPILDGEKTADDLVREGANLFPAVKVR